MFRCFLLLHINYIIINNIIPRPAHKIAATVIHQKYFFMILFAASRNRQSRAATAAKRAVRNIADTPKNKKAGNPMNPAHIAINLYGTGVNAVIKIINRPCFTNKLCAISNFSIVAKFWTSHTPIESNSQNPIMYAIAPPTRLPNAAAIVIGTARRRFAMIGGVIKTSGGTNKNIDSHTVKINTIHEYAGCSDFCKTDSTNFMTTFRFFKIFLDCIHFSCTLQII